MSKYNKILADVHESVFALCLNNIVYYENKHKCNVRLDEKTLVLSGQNAHELNLRVNGIINDALSCSQTLYNKLHEKILQAMNDSPLYVDWLYREKIISVNNIISQAFWTNTKQAWDEVTTDTHCANPSDVLIEFTNRKTLGLSLKSTSGKTEIGMYNGSLCSFLCCVVYGQDTAKKDIMCPRGTYTTDKWGTLAESFLGEYEDFTQTLLEDVKGKKELAKKMKIMQQNDTLEYEKININKLRILHNIRDNIIETIQRKLKLELLGPNKYINRSVGYEIASHIIAGMLRITHCKLISEDNYTKLTSFGIKHNMPPLIEKSTLEKFIKSRNNCSVMIEKIETGAGTGVSFYIKFGDEGTDNDFKKGFRIRVKVAERPGSAVKINGKLWHPKKPRKPRKPRKQSFSIDKSYTKQNIYKKLNNKTVKQLRKFLQKQGLSHTGKKIVLIERIVTNFFKKKQGGGDIGDIDGKLLNELIIRGIDEDYLPYVDKWDDKLIYKSIFMYLYELEKGVEDIVGKKLIRTFRLLMRNLRNRNKDMIKHIEENKYLYPRTDDYDKFGDYTDEEQFDLEQCILESSADMSVSPGSSIMSVSSDSSDSIQYVPKYSQQTLYSQDSYGGSKIKSRRKNNKSRRKTNKSRRKNKK